MLLVVGTFLYHCLLNDTSSSAVDFIVQCQACLIIILKVPRLNILLYSLACGLRCLLQFVC
jgi:hypothetical protein